MVALVAAGFTTTMSVTGGGAAGSGEQVSPPPMVSPQSTRTNSLPGDAGRSAQGESTVRSRPSPEPGVWEMLLSGARTDPLVPSADP